MAARFGPGAQQFPSPQSGNMPLRPGYMRLGSSSSLANGNGNPPANGGPGGFPMQQRQVSGGGSGQRNPDRKDTKEVAWVHWRALKDFLTAWGDKGASSVSVIAAPELGRENAYMTESPTARASAREKLTRLTRLQFLELSTDVYDELMRRLAVENGSSDSAGELCPPS